MQFRHYCDRYDNPSPHATARSINLLLSSLACLLSVKQACQIAGPGLLWATWAAGTGDGMCLEILESRAFSATDA